LLLQLRAHGYGLARIPGRLERIGHQLLEPRDIEGLEEVIVGPQLHGLDRRLRGAVGSHEDHRKLRIQLPNAPQSLQSIEPGHADIAENQVWLQNRDEPYTLLAARRGMKLNVRGVKDPAE
jgi:hypothetical protein